MQHRLLPVALGEKGSKGEWGRGNESSVRDKMEKQREMGGTERRKKENP